MKVLRTSRTTSKAAKPTPQEYKVTYRYQAIRTVT